EPALPPLLPPHAAATRPTTAVMTTSFFRCFIKPPSGLGCQRNVFLVHRLVVRACPFLPLLPPFFLVLIRVPGRVRIKGVPEPVADQVERDGGSEQEQAGEEHGPPGDLEYRARIGDLRTPRRGGRGNADPQE